MATKEERTRLLGEADFEKKQLVIATLLTLVGTAFVLARLYVRGRYLKQWFIDDWFILLAMILGTASFVFWGIANIPELLVHQRNGSSEPTSEADAETRELAQAEADNYNLIGLAWNCACIALQATAGRLSVFYTFRRLSSSQRTRNIRRLIHVVAAVMVLATIALVWLSLSPCWPPRDIKLANGKGCWIIGDYLSPEYRPLKLWLFLFSSILNAIMDLFAFTLPFLIFRGTSLTGSQKQGLYYLFGFGLVVFTISLSRAIISAVILINNMDGSQISTTPLLLGLTEANGVMVGGALPVLVKPLFGTLWSRASAVVQRSPAGSVTAVLRDVSHIRDVSDEARAASSHYRSDSRISVNELPASAHYRSDSKYTVNELPSAHYRSDSKFRASELPSAHYRSDSKFTVNELSVNELPWDLIPPHEMNTARSSRTYVESSSVDDYPQFIDECDMPSVMLRDHVFPMGTYDFRRDCERAFQIVHSDAEDFKFCHAK